ncbi:MAG: hypothetical protein IH951_16325 [Bacteroidetes bacterium]|nr:hypothetical protein [Bacteroidota bacterium]
MAAVTHKPLSRDDLQVLFGLDCGLPAIQRDLELAARIGYYPEAHVSRHRALNFAFRYAPTAVITITVLRFSEVLELQLERASLALLGRSLWVGRGRTRRLADPDFQRLYELRVAHVAHGIKLRAWGETAIRDVKDEHGTVITFMLATLTKLRTLLEELKSAGLFRNVEGLAATVTLSNEFTDEDLSKNVAVASS